MKQDITNSSPQASSQPSCALPRRPRIALYSQDAVGLGHLRRNILIAQTLAHSELAASSLLISGAHEANFFPLPDGVDCVTLPRLGKNSRGQYHAARLDMSLDELARLRQELICAALEQFEPDIMIIDFRPTGICDELMPALELLAHRGRTRIVLGLRDVIDDLSVVQSDWLSRRKVQVVEQFYDAVWIYGDSRVFNPVREYSFPPLIADKTRFTGYLDQSSRLNGAPVDDRRWAANGDSHPQRKTVACVVGGGSDGSRLIETFVDAVLPEIEAVVLTGPYIPRPDLAAIKLAASKLPNVQILEFSTEADWLIANVDRVVAMAGYNTVCSILSFGKPALLVPRITPRREQWIRAELFSKLKLVDVLSPDQLTPGSLTAWMMQGANGCHRARDLVDLNGLDRIVQLTAALLPANGGHMERNAPPATAPLAGNEVR